MEPIAVVGISNLFPGSKNPQEFWQNLVDKKDTRTRLTSEDVGVDLDAYLGKQGDVDKLYCQYGGYIRDFTFDKTGYAIDESELERLDELYQWTLYTAREALKDAGILNEKELLKRCGVILANLSFPTRSSNALVMPIYKEAIESSLESLAFPNGIDLPYSTLYQDRVDDTSNMLIAGYPAALVSKALGLGGINFALDAACASSCYSVKLACDYLNTGKADVMLSGAVSAADPLFISMGFSIFHAYPDDERSAPLDANSKGLFAGEGAAFFVLKRYADAVRDGDQIHALIKGGGLSNDGKGEFVLSPNSKGQVLAYQRAYDDAQVNPASVHMVECHATGTPKGDRVELSSMGQYFSQYQGKPLIGSVKSNLSHLLTAAGMPSMMKVMLSMKNKLIPATINLEEAVQAKDKYFGAENIPVENVSWTETTQPRRAGVSTFGFGGSNAHLVFEEADSHHPVDVSSSTVSSKRTPLSIVSMAAHFGQCENVTQLQSLLVNGQTSFSDLPALRWRGLDRQQGMLKDYGLLKGKAPQGSYIEKFDVDFMYFKIPPRKTDALIAQQMLMLKVADEAVHQAQLKPGSNVAVLVAMGVELEMHRYRGRVNLDLQIKTVLKDQGIELTSEEEQQLIQLCKQSMHDEVSINQYTSFIGNIMASRVSALWDFSGPAFTVSAEENSVYQCLDLAENLFNTSDVDAVVIAAVDLAGSAEHVLLRQKMHAVSDDPAADKGWFVGEGAGAIVVKAADRVQPEDNVIANIDACQLVTGDADQALTQATHEALSIAGSDGKDVVYVEMNASGFESDDLIEQDIAKNIYSHVAHMGSVKNNIGHCFSASGMASIIKIASCMSAGKIPKSPEVKSFSVNNNGQTTVETAWLMSQRAVINSIGRDGRSAHVVMSPKGQMRHVERAEAKRQLIRQVYLGDEAIQDKILNEESILAFAELKSKNLKVNKKTNKNMREEYVSQEQSSHDIHAEVEPKLGSFIGLNQLMNSQKRSSVSEARAKKLLPLALKENYTPTGELIWGAEDLLEFAEGDIANVFGEEFAIIDSYSRRVRLPMSDYLLVTRVTELQATPNVYEPCMMTTEYDVPLDAPYLVDGQISWAVAVESGQCDLLLISYLGIDFKNKGNRVYRLLDCQLTFIGDLAFGGETLRYEIHIDSFASQGDTLLFFFHYDCYVRDRKVIEMRGGCAGFFSDEELAAGKGVVRTARELKAREQIVKQSFTPLLSCSKTEFSYEEIQMLIDGDFASCFGANYEQNGFNPSMCFSSEKFLMHDHITSIDIHAGAWGLGLVESYKILQPDHWYFPCHFKGDQVMAGSLMADGCGQLLMFYMMYLGLHTQTTNGRFHPMQNETQTVRCRGQVLPQNNKLHYKLEVTEIGVSPRIYVKANVEIILDGKVVVDFENMCVEIKEQDPAHPYAREIPNLISQNGSSSTAVKHAAEASPFGNNVHAPLMRVENDLDAPTKHGVIPVKHFEAPVVDGENREPGAFPFTPFHFFEFATGSIAKCFGEEFSFYDSRIPPRTPCGDLQLTTRVLSVDGVRGELKTVSSCVAEYEVPADAWYFKKGAHPSVMPYSVLMEISLQPNGFLSAYMGTTLVVKDQDVFFRNLDGSGELLRRVDLRGKTIVNKSVLLSTTILGTNIIQSFTFELFTEGEIFYQGTAVFGYFSADALEHQLGLDKGQVLEPWHVENNQTAEKIDLTDASMPLFQIRDSHKLSYRLAGGQLNFIDSVEIVDNGGKYNLGYIYAERTVDPSDWFFQFHFHQDPVMPGSLGVEAIIEAMQTYMLHKDLGASLKNPRFAQPMTKVVWKYRGQINPLNKQMSLDIHIKDIVNEEGRVTLVGDANLSKDGLRIYEVQDIVVSLEEA